MDNAWDYHDGRSEMVMGKALKGRRDEVFLMTKVCAHIRGQTRQAVMEMLEESLSRLQTDHFDLWMLHELTTMDQVNAAFTEGGPLEGLLEAKKQGKVRYIGFTGHASTEVHMAMLKPDFPFDAVLMPINAFEQNRKGFRDEVLPELQKRGIGILGMKGLGGTPARVLRDGRYTAKQLLRFSLSHPITTQIVGMRSIENVNDNLEIARAFTPMPKEEMESLIAQLSRENAEQLYAEYQCPGYRDGRGRVA
jgi:predicted aldo/keto reductase-like oxidoreductase